MIDELGTGRVTIRPDFTGLREALTDARLRFRVIVETAWEDA